ncbi:MAG: hypothetical protein R2834_20475 [Rhodothermales bacterium]
MLRALDDASILDRYLEIKARIAELEEELESLKAPLIYALMEEPRENAQYKGFELSIQRRKTYAYSEKVTELEEVLKEARAHEREAGIAEVAKDQAILVVRAVNR